MQGPLAGIRVLDLTSMISGPLSTMTLADQGADVIKVESPAGDYARNLTTRRNGFSASFVNNNRNKRSIVLDLKQPSALMALERLIDRADVMVQNFQPGVAERMGIGPIKACQRNPALIYLSICGFGFGFGFDGPYRDKPAFDPLIQALSMLDTVVSFLWSSDMGGRTFIGNEHPAETAQSFNDLIDATTDGHVSIAVMQDKHWRGFLLALNRPDLPGDGRFATPELREINKDERTRLIQRLIEGEATDTLIERLEAHDLPCAPVLTRRQMIRHPQVLANGIVHEVDHPHAGAIRQTRPAAVFSSSPPFAPRGAPVLGEHTEAILAEAGIDAATSATLLREGAAIQYRGLS